MCLFKCGLVGRSPSVSCLHLSRVSKEQDVICQAALAFYILPSCQLSFSAVCRVKLCSSSCKTLTSNTESFILDGESGQLARIYMCNDNLCALYVKDCNVLLLHNNLIASFKKSFLMLQQLLLFTSNKDILVLFCMFTQVVL